MIRALWLIPVIVAVGAHASALASGFTNWDDPHYLVNNAMTIHPLGSGWLELLLTPDLYYPIPVTVLGYAGQRALFGLDPAWFHLVSIALHVGVTTLIWALARRVGASRMAATIAASLFAVHPLCVEPVAWVTGQKDLLCALFILGALVVRARRGDPGRWRTAAAIALAAVAMLSKPTAVCAPVLFAAVDWALDRRLRRHLATYGILLAFAAAITALSLWGHERVSTGPSEHFGLGSLARAAWAVKLQFVHTLAPTGLAARYYPPSGFELALGVGAGLLALAAFTGLFVRSVRRGQRVMGAGLLCGLAAYAPTSGLLPLSRGAADSYMYLPLALALAFAAVAIDRGLERSRRNMLIAAALIGICFAALSWSNHRHWRGATTLWYRVVDLNPDEPHAMFRLANGFLYTRRPDLALEMFELIVDEHPDFIPSRTTHAVTLVVLGRVSEADVHFAAACVDGDLYALSHYGSFLINHDVYPADDEAARTALLLGTPLLATRGKNPRSLGLAIRRLRGYGHEPAARLLELRLREISER